MKKVGLLLLLFVSLISCSNNDSDDKAMSTDYFGKWELFINSKYVDTSINKPNLFYTINKDNTFIKTSIYNGVTTTASGTFTVRTDKMGTYFIFNYKEQSSLIANCTGGLVENLFLDESGYLNQNLPSCDSFEKYKKAK